MEKILFVCGNPPHPIHSSFANAIGADFYHLPDGMVNGLLNLRKIPKGYDIYFTEGLFSYAVLARKFGFINKNAKIINLFADPRLFQLIDNKKFNFDSLEIEKFKPWKRKVIFNLIKKLDGAICLGPLQEELFRKVAPDVPVEVAYSYINRKDFFKFKSRLDKNNILFVGGGEDYYCKGLDFLIEVFLKVNEKFKKSKLFIVGGNWNNFKKDWPNVEFAGNQDLEGLKTYMKNSALYCHFGRGDAFPVASLEAMAAGIPCLTSDTTGIKKVVGDISKDYVFSLNEKNRAMKVIMDYFDKPVVAKKRLGSKFSGAATFFNETSCINLFKEKFSLLTKRITGGKS